MPWAGLRPENRPLSRGMHKEKCRHRLRPASGAPVFANGAVTAAMSFSFGELARGSATGNEQADLLSMSDEEIDALIASQFDEEAVLDSDFLLAECGGCIQQDIMQREFLAGRITEADLLDFHTAQGAGALIGLGGLGGAGVAIGTARAVGSGVRALGGGKEALRAACMAASLCTSQVNAAGTIVTKPSRAVVQQRLRMEEIRIGIQREQANRFRKVTRDR